MPHKFNAARRHKFDKAQYRVINWAEYNESLRQRGDLTIWVSDEAQSVWSAPRRTSLGIPLIVNTSSGIMNTDSGHREHSPERSDGLASQFIPSESRFSLF